MNTLKQIITQRGISQNVLSQEARVPASSLSLIVNGKLYACPAWRARIAKALRVSEEVLFPREGNGP